MGKELNPSEQLKQFLDFVDESRRKHSLAFDQAQTEERRQTDLLHEIEFATGAREFKRLGEELNRCRNERRRCKDTVKRHEMIIAFFADNQNQKAVNQMRQLLGRQRKEEEFLDGERIYKKRV